MFQNSPKINLAESLFSGLYVVVCRTEGTSDRFYHRALDFLNSELCSFNVANLIANFLSDEDAEWAGDAFPFAAKLTLGPTQILWNTEPENAIPREELLNAAKAREILGKIGASACAGQTGSVQIKYVAEESLAGPHIPRLFYAGNVVATVVVNELDDLEFADLVDFYHGKKPLYGDERNLKFQFLVSKATPKFTVKVMAEYEKYIVKTNLYKYRKSKQVWGDDDLIMDALILVDDVRLVRQALREVVHSLATTFVALALELLNRPENSLERVKRPALHPGSSKAKNAPYKGAHVKNLGDLYKVLGNEDCAIVYYLAAAYYFSLEKNYLEQARALFCMVVSICRKFGFWHFLDSEYHSMFSFQRHGDADGDAQALGADKHVSESEAGLGGADEDAASSKEVPKKIREKPVEQIMHYTRRAYALWLRAIDNSDEFQILFAFFVNMLLRAESPAIHEVVASYIAYADAMLTLEQRCNVLRYAMEAMKRRSCRRKVAFYGFLLDERTLELAGKEERAAPCVDKDGHTACATDSGPPGYGATKFIVHNLNPVERRDVRTKLKHYEHWHGLKRAIAENEIRRLKVDGNSTEVHRTVMLNFWNLLRRLEGATVKIDHNELAAEVAALTSHCKGAETGHFKISHIVLSNGAGGVKQTPGAEVYNRLVDPLRGLFVRLKGEDTAYAGGFEDLSFSKFPIAHSLRLPESYFDYKYTRCRVPVAKREPQRTGDRAEFCMTKGRRGRVRCNYSSIHARGFTDSIALESQAGDDATGRVQGAVSSPRMFEPRCTVVTGSAASNTTCRIRAKSSMRHKGMKIARLSESPAGGGVAWATHSELPEVTEERVVFVDKALRLEVTFRNPLPTDLELTNVEILAEGAKFEGLVDRVFVPAFAWRHTIDVNLVVLEPGVLHITGIKFVLFDAFECTQLLLNTADGRAVEFINGLVDNLDPAENTVLQNLRDSAFVELNAVKDYKKSRVDVLFADFAHGSHESQIDFENGLIKLTDKFADATSLSSLRSSRRSSNWTNNLDTQRSSVPWTNTSSPRGKCELWNGLMLPNFGPEIAGNELKTCGDPLCSWCTAFCHLHDKLTDGCEGSMLPGEKKLMYARLQNDNPDHAFVNLRISVSPTTHAPDENYRILAKTAEDRERDRLVELKVQRLKRQIYSRYVVILNDHCVKMRAENESEPDHDWTQIVLRPNEAVYVPIVYRANQALTKFNVIFDYDSVKVDSLSNYKEATLAIANAHKAVKLELGPGISFGRPRMEQRLEFNHRLFVRNLGQFKDVFSDATLQRMKRFKPVFDQGYAVAFVKVKNKTDSTFSCTIGETQFVSTPWSATRWPVTLRKWRYTRARATDPVQLARLAEGLDLKWSLAPDRTGSIKLYDLGAEILTNERLRSYVERDRHGFADFAATSLNSNPKVPEWYTAKVQRLIDNAGILERSKLALKVATKLSGEAVGFTRKSVKVAAGATVEVDVLVANRGERAVREYRVVVVPHVDMTYAQACGLEWTGALEQVGLRPILPRARAPKTQPSDPDGGSNEAVFDDYTSVASVAFRPTQRCDLAISAAVVVDRERTIFWHHEPVVVSVE